MNCVKKYNVNVEKIHVENLLGLNLRELSKKYGIPKTTIGRYLRKAGHEIKMNGRNPYKWMTENFDYTFSSNSTVCWKQALVYYHGHKCFVCGYDKIVEAHHILPLNDGGLTTIRNGILLCPNCHAEVHRELLDLTKALVKLDELLENLYEGNQQPSCICKHNNMPRDTEGSETSRGAKAIILPRASRSRRKYKRYSKKEYFKRSPLLRDMI